MAIGHIAVRTHHRDRGHTAAAALAYRFGAALTCPRTLERHDYRRREADGEIAAKGMYAPIDTPLADSLDALAAGIETAERRKASRITRDVQIALPTELTESDRIELAREFAETIATRYGTVAAWAVHRPDDTGDERNAHAHILIPTRRLDNQGQLGAKLRVLDQKSTSHAEIKAIRALWQETANAKLRKKHIDARVDTGRTTDPAPTLGPRDTAIERRARKGRRSVSVADLVADGQSVTPRGRRLQRHERRRRKARLGPEHTAALHDTGKTLEEHRAAPVPTPRLTSIEATRATLSAGSAAPVPRAAPTAPASTRATLSAGSAAPVPQAAPTAPASTRATLSAHSAAPVPKAAPTAPASTRATLSAHSAAPVPKAAPTAPASTRATLSAGSAAPVPKAAPTAPASTRATLSAGSAAPVPKAAPTAPASTRATLSAHSAAPVPKAAPTAPASTRATLSAGSAAPVPKAAPTAPASTRATLSAGSAAPVPQAAPTAPASTRAALSAHSAARVPQAAPSAPVSLMETLDAVMRWTGIRALHMLDNAIQTAQAEKTHMTRRIDEIARARRRRTPAVQAHADTHGQAPTPEESATTAERLRRGFNDLVDPIARQKFFPLTVEGTPKSTIELLHSPKACQTAAGAAAASKPLDQALDQIEREESDQTRRLDSRRAALLQRWRKVRGPVIRKMVQAATGIEAIAARRRLQKPEQRDRDATARRRQVAEVPTQPAPDRGRSR